ncbi:hypothetical protein [Mycolicibacterium fortuitum]|uniref:hypothetical protein n=1 Tax=Mycolicibacterium fortuitum TaxID=1766 RepID=UPI001CDBBDFD|nr:hypothetical protein [Mycolicibacterium fortuitum]UBV13045.1 hypothetical protein H8Z57_19435 [Mycolicibacterium fortuitum]
MNLTDTSRTGGDTMRARLADPSWIAAAGPAELRAAVHALCWRTVRSTIDGFCTDLHVASKVLITARGVKAELDARLALLDARTGTDPDERAVLLRRSANATEIVAACDAAVQFAQMRDARWPAASDLVAAIADHRRRVSPEDACDADTALWRVLDDAEHLSPTSNAA